MPRLPIEIEREAEYNVAYVRYQDDSSRGIGKTIGHAGDQIDLDLDEARSWESRYFLLARSN